MGKPQGLTKNRRRAGGAVLVFAIMAAGYYGWTASDRPHVPDQPRTPERSHASATARAPATLAVTPARAAGYVGMEACAECHAERVAEFRKTNHARTSRLVRAEDMPAGFAAGKGSFTTRYDGLRFEMSREGDAFVQTTIQASPTGNPHRSSTRIDMVYGAGTTDDIYLTWHGEQLYELPMAWLYPFETWASQGFDPYGAGDFARPLTPRCLECHNTWFQHVAGTPNEYKRDDFVLGVTCERCHGPGREHSEYHRSHPEADVAHAVVHPGELSRELALDVCVQCHGNAIKHRGPAFSYRPGTPLESSYMTVSVHREEDHVANQIHYLRQSKCFQESETLTCTSCHDPHTPTDSQLVRESCLECHQPEHCADRERLPAAVADDCVGCHMPPYVKMNVNFDTEDELYVPPIRRYEHRIAVYPAARQEVLREWYRTQPDAPSRQEADRLTAELVEHWLTEAEELREQYRYKGAIGAVREALRIAPTSEAAKQKLDELIAVQAKLDEGWFRALRLISQNRLKEAMTQLKEILALKPDHAEAHGRLGTLYATRGETKLAEQHLNAVAGYDPNDAYGEGMLGWLAYLDKRPEEALQHYRRAEKIEPYYAKLHYQMGLALAQLTRFSEAAESFRKALEIDPNHIDSCQVLSQLLAQQGKFAEALPLTRHAAELTGYRNLEILLQLAEMSAEAGRFDEAIDAAARALGLAQSQRPDLVPPIKQRLETFRQLRQAG